MTAAEIRTEYRLRDGSTRTVDDDGRMATVCREADGRSVWGQVFSHSWPEVHARQVGDVLAAMCERPEAFDRRLLWDENGRAVRA